MREAPHPPHALSFATLRDANIRRQQEWFDGQPAGLPFRAVELAGEAGEACNIVKKLERERLGIRGSRASLFDLADEIADVVIAADLLAMEAGINLAAAVTIKFDRTSEKNTLATRLGDADAPSPAWDDGVRQWLESVTREPTPALRAALKDYLASQGDNSAAIPEGYQLVPVEPKKEMLSAGEEAALAASPATTKSAAVTFPHVPYDTYERIIREATCAIHGGESIEDGIKSAIAAYVEAQGAS